MVEILKNNRVIHRDFPMDRRSSRDSWENAVLIWFEYGWGPWAGFAIHADREMVEVADWDVRIDLEPGVLEDVLPAFKAGPFEESRRDRFFNQTNMGFDCSPIQPAGRSLRMSLKKDLC